VSVFCLEYSEVDLIIIKMRSGRSGGARTRVFKAGRQKLKAKRAPTVH